MSIEVTVYVIIAIILATFIAVFQYKKKGNGFLKKNVLYIVLRTISIATVLILLINPQFKKISLYVEKPKLVLVTDNSSSISFLKGQNEVQNSIESFQQSETLKTRFDLEFTTFGERIRLSDTLNFSEKQTRITEALNSVKQTQSKGKSAIVFISDGNQTYGEDYSYSTLNYTLPVYPVIIGDTVKYRDLSITQLNVNKYAYYKNEFPLEIILNYSGEGAVQTQFQIEKEGKIIYSKPVSLSKNKSSEVISTTLNALDVGVQLYKAILKPISDEKNSINNEKEFAVEVIDQKTNILIVSDILHPDIGAFKKSIESSELRSVTIAKSNLNAEELDDYQMVILYQPNSRFTGIVDAIKKRNLNTFIVAGTKTDWNFLNRYQQDFSREYIRQVEDIQGSLNQGYVNFAIDDIGFDDYPPLQGFLGEITLSENAAVILNQRIRNVETNNPLLFTVENQGLRSAVLLGENLWKWRAQNFLDTNNFKTFDDFIGKIIFYLASSKKRSRLSVTAESFYNGNSEIKVSAQYFDKNYEFNPNANITITTKHQDNGNERSVPLLLQNNYYEADLKGLDPGTYDYTVRAEGENIIRTGTFRVLDFDIEKQFLNANYNQLNALAQNTGGQLFFPNQLEDLENALMNDESFIPIQKSKEDVVPLIDWKILLLLLIFSLALEWFLRKYNGLI